MFMAPLCRGVPARAGALGVGGATDAARGAARRPADDSCPTSRVGDRRGTRSAQRRRADARSAGSATSPSPAPSSSCASRATGGGAPRRGRAEAAVAVPLTRARWPEGGPSEAPACGPRRRSPTTATRWAPSRAGGLVAVAGRPDGLGHRLGRRWSTPAMAELRGAPSSRSWSSPRWRGRRRAGAPGRRGGRDRAAEPVAR